MSSELTAKDRLLYLVNLLEDEFREFAEVRVRPVFPSGTRRSLDLEQDYDPETSSVHLRCGVVVQTRRHEFFFPEEWIHKEARARLYEQVQAIRETL